jgi:hypothetical protein
MNDFALEIKAKALMKLKQEADQLIDLLGNLRESYNLMTLAQVLKKTTGNTNQTKRSPPNVILPKPISPSPLLTLLS